MTLKYGVVYPMTEAAGDPDDIHRFVLATQTLGYQYILVYDHVLKASHANREPMLSGPYNERDAIHDPFTFFAFVAGMGSTLEFATGVLVLPQRQTAVVAQQAADVDLLSRERLRMGAGAGWNWVEYAALGQNFHTRGMRLDEQIGLLRRLWSEPLVDFEGRFERIDRAGINPRPRRQIPIWIGGSSEAAYSRAARLGDGFIFAGTRRADEGIERVRHHLGTVGRPIEGFGFELLAPGETVAAAADLIKSWDDAGGTHAAAFSMGRGFGQDIGAHIGFYEEFKRRLH